MEGRRRRAQQTVQAPEEAVQTIADAQEELTSAAAEAPRRRRRAQPPQQITQRMKKVTLPEDEAPVIQAIQPQRAEKKKQYKKAPRRKIHQESGRQQAAQIAGKAAKNAQRAAIALGGMLLSALMTLAAGAGKLKEKISGLKAKQQAKPGEEIVLEAIRPEDYHGRGAQHARLHEDAHKKPAAMPKISLTKDGAVHFVRAHSQQLISAALVIVALVSLWQIASILLRTLRTTRLNAQLSERYANMSSEMPEESGEDVPFVVYTGEETPQPDAQAVMVTPQPTEEPDELRESEATPEPKPTRAPEVVKSTKFHQVGGDALPEMAALYDENRDLIAWLNIPDVIDLPVVYKDNDYYLKRDFYKQKNTAGTIFLDENHPFKEKAQNLLLHGHNMKDGTMFGRLTQYIYDRTYIKNHPFINLSTLWRKEQYVIFAVLDVSLNPKDEAFFNYFTHHTFSSDAEFTSYIRQLQLRSMFAIPIDVDPSDALLTLSTCLEDNRLVIVARRLRTGETRSELRQRIHTATRQ